MKKIIDFFREHPFWKAQNIFVALGVLLIFFIALRPATDPDMGWHLKDGEYILENNFRVAKTDIFSHSMPNFPLIMHEWVTDVGMFLIYDHLGLFALSVLFAVITTVGFLLASWGVKSKVEYKIIASILGAIASIPVLGVRPQMFNLLGLALVIFIIFRFRENINSRLIFWLPLILWLWVNLHGGFSVGLFFVGLFSVLELVKTAGYYSLAKFKKGINLSEKLKNNTLPLGAIWKLGVVGAVSALATLVNPYGWRVYVEIVTTIFDTYAKANINEWMPVTYANPMSSQFLVYLVLLGILLLFNFRKTDWTYAGMAGVFLWLGFSSWRHMPIFLIVSAPLWVGIVENLVGDELLKVIRKKWALLLLLVAVAIISRQQLQKAWEYGSVEKIAQGNYPMGAVQYLRDNPIEGEMFNEYNWGGFLIWQYPEKKVYIDGRMPSWRKNGFSIFEEFNNTLKYNDGWDETFDKHDIQFVLVYNNIVNRVMFLNLGWKEVFNDGFAAIYRRNE